MPTLHDLIDDIGAELGGSVPSNLGFLIRSVEFELWHDLWFLAPQKSVIFTFLAGTNSQNLSTQLTNPDRVLFLEALIREEDGVPLRRMDLGQILRLSRRGLQNRPEYFYADINTDSLMVYPIPRVNTDLSLVFREKPEPLNENSNDTNNPMLGDAYEVLKWGVLYKRIFNPDKFQYWRLQFNEAYQRLHQRVMRANMTYRGGTRWHDASISY